MSVVSSIIPADKLSSVDTYYFAKKLKEIAELNRQGNDIINLGIGSPDMPPPDSVSQALIKGLSNAKAHQYQSYYGLPELRLAFAEFYSRHFDVVLNAEKEVLPLMGSKEGIMHISMSFLNPGDHVLVPNLGYPAYKMTSLLTGAIPQLYDLKEETDWIPDFNALEKMDLTKVKIMWVNYPNMPTGSKGSRSLFKRLIEFGLKHNILICHDNPYALILNEKPLSILSIPGAKKTALELTSLSKCFNMAGWRVGAVLGSEEFLKSIIKFKSNMDSGMFMPIQLAAIEALKLGTDWFHKLNHTYQKRRAIAWSIFKVLGIEFYPDAVGLFVWGNVPYGTGEQMSDLLLKEASVFVTPGFIFGDNGMDYIRISLCSPIPILEDALERIASAKIQLE